MLKVSRADLVESKVAIHALGNIFISAKDNYHLAKLFARTVRLVNSAIHLQTKLAQAESNRLVEELGTMQKDAEGKDTRKGIQQADIETMNKYSAAMDAFMAEMVEVDVRMIWPSDLKAAEASLKVSDMVALHWLLAEKDVDTKH